MEQRNMMILWHWKRIRRDNQDTKTRQLCESIQVANHPKGDDVLRNLTILDEGDRIPQDIIDNIKTSMEANQINHENNCKWLIFLHKDSFDHRKFPHLATQLKQDLDLTIDEDFELISFGGGDPFIYYKKLTDTGLLDQFGRFMHSNCRVMNDPKDDWGFRTVLTNPEEEKNPVVPIIKWESFDQVWKYYCYRYKRTLYEFQEQLLTQFVAMANEAKDAPSLLKYLEATDSGLAKQLSDICDWQNIQSAQIGQVYSTDTVNINKMYKELVNFISTEPINSTNLQRYLINLRKKIYPLLEAMPESIY